MMDDSTSAAPPILSAATTVEFEFLRGRTNSLEREHAEDHDAAVSYVRRCLTEVLNAPNLSFLIGAGCSSLKSKEPPSTELGIPTMGDLATEFFTADATKPYQLTKAQLDYLASIAVDTTLTIYRRNLERFMEILHAHRFVLDATKNTHLKIIEDIIGQIQLFILHKCLNGPFASGDRTISALYEKFFRKLVYRDRALPRPWIFSTNYDLFSERALDSLGISYCNGFAGIVDRSFNPATFKYALAEQLDVSSRKWTVVDNHIYLCKLHGSINWVADANAGIYGIREIQSPTSDGKQNHTLIFPSPLKHHATLASPYTDLFREFQSRIVREQTVLVTIGYAFGDEHIDAIIHQALTVPTFRLVVFGSRSHPGIKKLIELDDPRIWVIGGKSPDGFSVHYFDYLIQNFLPDLPSDRIDRSVMKVVDLIRASLTPPDAPGSAS